MNYKHIKEEIDEGKLVISLDNHPFLSIHSGDFVYCSRILKEPGNFGQTYSLYFYHKSTDRIDYYFENLNIMEEILISMSKYLNKTIKSNIILRSLSIDMCFEIKDKHSNFLEHKEYNVIWANQDKFTQNQKLFSIRTNLQKDIVKIAYYPNFSSFRIGYASWDHFMAASNFVINYKKFIKTI